MTAPDRPAPDSRSTQAAPAPRLVDRRCSQGGCPHKGIYRMIGGCYNCRTEPLLGLFSVSHEAQGGDCPVCGTNRLHWDRLATPDEIPADFEGEQP